MKYIHYDGSLILTGDAIADAVVDYAAVLGANGRTDTVAIPAVADDGSVTRTTVLVGPASELTVSTAPDDELEPEDRAFIRKLRDAASRAGSARPVDVDGGHRFVGADEPDEPADRS
ncbi:hypothetical protein GCM10017714_17370 [Curtobacterium pusillum]|uniref:Uncharacterized protein n=1 Tax=Curtobacterium pusillum TaxID=69373 RepID=A0AAW3T957_9MICO|nr:hypothetical protein [Curtobacterium pusillum]MBA8991230.1 hypothetical protein [Curtobacterium pusillum]NUU14420.1 hypothetical protein [Curtobacterium pusillum]GLK30996.1 hypothetical protein GCM10017610_12810 [Curtobacterium pusillum]